MVKTVKKVGGDDVKDKEPKGRIEFPRKTAQYVNSAGALDSAINTEDLLIAVPAKIVKDGKTVYAGFDLRKHKPLKKSDFASMALFMQFQGYVAMLKAEFYIKIAEDRKAKADRLLKFGDEATRKKAAKIARMREQLKALTDQLAEEGIDVTDI
jgi:hypothetical protein